MINLKNETYSKVGEKLLDMGNFSILGLTFGAIFSSITSKIWIITIGIILWISLYIIGTYFIERRDQ